MTDPRRNLREIRASRGTTLRAKSWLTEAPLRMLMNNLDPDVAENPSELVVYGGIGRAARTWQDFDRIVTALEHLEKLYRPAPALSPLVLKSVFNSNGACSAVTSADSAEDIPSLPTPLMARCHSA